MGEFNPPSRMRNISRLIPCLMTVCLVCEHSGAQTALAEPAELTKTRAVYQQQIKMATDPIKQKYVEYLEGLKKTYGAKGFLDAALAIQTEIDSLGIVTATPIGAKSDKIIIWNQNNGGKGDRGSKKVNVMLFAGGREVWSKKGIRLQWDADKQGQDEIPVPALHVDKIRVEVTELVNDKGGLAEVEYIKGGKNAALGGAVVVSGYWETNPKHAAATLTDGLPETFWLLNDKQEGWAEITLKAGQ
jgi:hypothetical protein